MSNPLYDTIHTLETINCLFSSKFRLGFLSVRIIEKNHVLHISLGVCYSHCLIKGHVHSLHFGKHVTINGYALMPFFRSGLFVMYMLLALPSICIVKKMSMSML